MKDFEKKSENGNDRTDERSETTKKSREASCFVGDKDKYGDYFADAGKDSKINIKGKTKTFYFRLFLSFFIVIVMSTMLMAMLVYVFRTDELEGYLDRRSILDAQRLRDVVAIAGKDRELEEGVLLEFTKGILTDDYEYKFYSDWETLEKGCGLSLSQRQKTDVDFGKVICSEHTTVVKLGKYYLAVEINSTSTTDLGRLWYSIIWMAACVTLILAMIFNTFATSWVVKPVKKLSNGMLEVSKGNFDIKIDVDGSDEMASLQKTFNMMTEGLKKNEEASKTFVATLSHEYKTPIAAISGYADLLRRNDLTEEERQEYLKVICDQAKRLSGLSTEMLQLARLESNVVGLERESFVLDEQIRTVVLALESQWGAKDIALDIDLDEVTIFANKSMLYHVWDNLIGNAIKFTPNSGSIAISLKIIDKNAVFTVKDSGCGISEEDLPKIFDRFYRSESSKNIGGNGLGLSITKRIIDLSGGRISVDSQLNCGTTMTVTLPLK